MTPCGNRPVAGADETGMRAEGSLHWLHVMRDEQWTLYYLVRPAWA
ncbi:hypothetical protein [Endozoicomonas sp. SCSIO W0465]|nr:hypothetical protein [Endozoicomonas sp. SCSIO W0465]USE35405.1 hypothetical protein MJO57_25430 [Endozoicomonas sp. SCSIO W0465]